MSAHSSHRRRVVTSEEARLWRDAMRGTKPLANRQLPDDLPPPAPPPAVPSPPPPAAAVPPPLRPAGPAVAAAPPPKLDHSRHPGLDKSTAQRLHRGAMTIDAAIDLHGLTQEVAHAALWRFVAGSAEAGRRCLLVITGKGSRDGNGVLRKQVPRWLNEAPVRSLVLAFTYAQPKHGGEGALYVLLKRRR